MPQLFLLCEYATLSGGENSMLATLDSVRRAGFSITAVAPPEGPLAEALQARSIEVVPFRVLDAEGGRLPRARLREDLAQVLKRRDPDLLDANSLSMGRLSGPVTAELNLASIAHLRDIINLSSQAITDLNRHVRLLAVSHAAREYHVANGLAAEKTHVLYNGVDLDRFCPRASTGYLHRELGLPPSAQLVGTIGQIGLRKGQDVFARAAVMLAEKLPNVHYAIIGRRWSQKAEARRFEADLQAAASGALSGRLHLLGFRTDVDRIFNELTLLAHPARQEPLGRVLLEAAAAGVPIVATDVGGTCEIFPADSHAARLVPPDDADALATAILESIHNESLQARLSASARRRAEEAFDARRAAAALIEHYRQLCNP